MTSPRGIFLLVGFLDLLSVSLILSYLDIHATELGFNYIQIGFTGAVFSVCQMISSPIVGSLSDVRGRKPILSLCLIICSFAYYWLGVTSSLFVFLALRALLGTFKHTQVLTRTLVPDYIDDKNEIAILYGKLMSLGSLGLALGPIISGLIMEVYPESGFNVVCTIISCFFIVNTGLINSLPELPNKKKVKTEAINTPKFLDSIINTRKQIFNKLYNIDWANYGDIFFFKLLMSISMGLYHNNFRLFLKTEHGTTPLHLGFIIALQAIIASIVNNSVAIVNKAYIGDRDYSQRIFHIFLVIVLSLVGLAVVPNISMYVVFLIPKAVFFTLARIVSLEVVSSRSQADNRGSLIGAFNSVRSVSGIVTPIIGGFINHYLGVNYIFFAGSLIASIGLVLSYRARSISLKEKNN